MAGQSIGASGAKRLCGLAQCGGKWWQLHEKNYKYTKNAIDAMRCVTASGALKCGGDSAVMRRKINMRI